MTTTIKLDNDVKDKTIIQNVIFREDTFFREELNPATLHFSIERHAQQGADSRKIASLTDRVKGSSR